MADEYAEWKAEQAARWLRHIRDLKHDISRLEDDIEVQRSLALPSGIDYSRPVVMSSPSADAIPNAVARLEESIARYATELVGYLDEKEQARACIGMLGDARYRAVLSLYYINGHSWATVGEKLKKLDGGRFTYSSEYCRHLRNDALPLVYDVMPGEWKTPIPRAD